MIASFPSPPFNDIGIGPLVVHVYGVLIGVGVLVAAVTMSRRYAAWGGRPEVLDRVILWTVVLGFVGARLAYVSTHLDRFQGRWYAVLFLWEGGLALFGGLAAGALTAVTMLRRAGGNPWMFADAGAVGLPLAQAIGRWGNYFNQELFGTPTDLPWAVEIDLAHRPAAYLDAATFHPTFLYESLWNLLVVVPLVWWLEQTGRVARGASIGVYLVMYGTVRYLTELLRTDTTFRLLGVSRNGWVAAGVVVAGGLLVVWRQRVGEPQALADDATGGAAALLPR